MNVINKAFKEGWGAVIAKTVSLDAGKVVNVTPRSAPLFKRRGLDVKAPAEVPPPEKKTSSD